VLRKRQVGRHFSRKLLALVGSALLVIVGTVGFAFAEPAALAASETTPTTVTADALPTWQINGVVWQQTTVGNTVYAVGSFTKARPPGVAAGGAGEIDANNIFAFDITTGNPIADFSHQLNGQALAVNSSPDGSTLYIGGDFTTVDGVSRNHLAAFDVTTGALTSWSPTTDGQVRSIVTTSGYVHVGGNFRSASGVARNRLAKFSASNGAITSWAPSVDDGYVWAMTLTPDTSSLVIGGSFTTVAGTSQYGMGKVDATTGAVQPWAASTRIRTAGHYGAITSLRTDGTQIYGSGYAFGTGASFEGTFAADPATGAINWVNDCLGDTYDVYPFNNALYSVSHSHDCTTLGVSGSPDTSPRGRWQEVNASWTKPTGTNGWKDRYGWDFTGLPNAANLSWYPSLVFGTYTSAGQAAWSITGSGPYLSFGGEFVRVNGVDQQGLTRFALPGSAPKKSGPVYAATQDPVATSTESGKVRIRWGALWDRDQATLTYNLYRDNAKIASFPNVASTFWNAPAMGYVDSGLTPGGSARYQVRAMDADGNYQWSVKTPPVVVSGAAPGTSTYRQAVLADGATHLWRMGEASGSTVVQDTAGFADFTAVTSSTFGGAGAITGDGDTSVSLTATGSRMTTTLGEAGVPTPVTAEAWVKTSSGSGGRIVGLGDSPTGTSVISDRVLYLDNAGRVNFMVISDTSYSARSVTAVNDGQWHHVAGTFADGDLSVYVDGKLGARVRGVPTPRDYLGVWRIGADTTSGFPNRPTNNSLVGSVDEVAIYPGALSNAQIQAHYVASGRSGTWTPVTDAYGQAVLQSSPDVYWRLSQPSGSTVTDYSGGVHDATASGAIQYAQPGALVGNPDPAMGFTTVWLTRGGYVIDKVSTANPTVYSEEVWFKTGSTAGGTLMGFGNASSGNSSSHDRSLYLTNAGKLRFGVNTGTQVVLESDQTVNDNQWHHVVATQGPQGMRLYVDGALTASNTTTTAQNYTGYWRLAQDNVWSGSTNKYFQGVLDEAAVYSRVLTPDEVKGHYATGSGKAPNTAPVAAFTSTSSQLGVTFDASTSTDSEGTIAGYAWDFGDGATGTGVTATHTYAAAGTYTITLTVTDADGGTGTTTGSVTVTAAFVYAGDDFTRTVSGGWGSATTGGDWTTTGTASRWNVGDSAGTVSLSAGSGPYASLPISVTDSESTVGVTTDKAATGGGQYVSLISRYRPGVGGYRSKIRMASSGVVTAYLGRTIATTTTDLVSADIANLTHTPGDVIRIKFQVSGTTTATLKIKVWKDGTSEPAAWSLTTTDSTPQLTSAGGFAFYPYLSGSATNAPVRYRFDSLSIGEITTP
jgi:hypothetical protein